jgi:hypothetical protein
MSFFGYLLNAGVDMVGKHHFKAGLTLKPEETNKYAMGMTGVLLATAFVSVVLRLPEKKLAWMVSLVNSFVMTVAGALYLTVKLPPVLNALGKGNFLIGEKVFHEPLSNFAALTCMWFLMANVFDLVFGLLFYRRQLGLLTAYVHHTVFIWTMVAATTGNGGFLTCRPFASAFLFVIIEELPTFLLALGSVVPACRTDLGFGLSFFAFRIAYHVGFFGLALYNRATVDTPVIVLYSLTLAMHVNWFYNWVIKYGVSGGKKTKKGEAGTGGTDAVGGKKAN